MKRLVFLVPIALFAVVAYFLFKGLVAPPPQELPSMLVNKPAPAVTFPALDAGTEGFGPKDFRAGHVSVVNFFASWCVPCRQEAPILPRIATLKGVALYGVAYKDMPDKARGFLKEVGDPYARVGIDEAGSAGIEWGITGVPETFVIDAHGTVLLRHQGPLTPSVIDSDILPAIARARASG